VYTTAILLLTPPLAGVAAGYLLGGRLAALANLRLRALWLLWVAAGIQATQYYVDPVRVFLQQRVGLSMLAIVFGIVVLWLGVNLHQTQGVVRVAGAAILLGALLNGAAILANGQMPYSTHAAQVAGLPPGIVTPKNVPGGAHTRLAFIGDVIPVPPLQKVVSPGDLLISVGCVVAIAATMRRRRRPSPQPVGEGVNHDSNLPAAPGTDGAVPDRVDRHAAVHDRRPQ
jgi:hypothetical protein